jgi:hypothetical protein
MNCVCRLNLPQPSCLRTFRAPLGVWILLPRILDEVVQLTLFSLKALLLYIIGLTINTDVV